MSLVAPTLSAPRFWTRWTDYSRVFNPMRCIIWLRTPPRAFRTTFRSFVFTSSIAAYGHPHDLGEIFDEQTPCHPCDPYGISKFACEQLIARFHDYYGAPDFTIFRPHNVFGPRQNLSDPYRNVVGILMARALKGEPMPIFGDGSQTRCFSYITSVASAIATSPNEPAARNRTFNIGGSAPMSG